MARFFPGYLLPLALAATAPCQAPNGHGIGEIEYDLRIRAGDPAARIRMTLAGVTADEIRVAMPIWRPGSYTVQSFEEAVSDVTATAAGEQLSITYPDPDRGVWAVATGGHQRFVIEYKLQLRGHGIGPPQRLRTEEGTSRGYRTYLLQGPATWLYVEGHLDVPHSVTFDLPEEWGVATGMTRTEDPRRYTCPDYDVFADCPMHLGVFERLSFEVHDVEHEVILSGFEKRRESREALIQRFEKIVRASCDMMGPPPYERYVFLLSFPGGGGLEHLNSTTISMMSLEGSDDRHNSIWDSLVSHEFFHLWNVKRLRPAALGPFDYGDVDPNRTRYLWVCEGVTSYFGDLLCVRAGLWDEETYWTTNIAEQINILQRNPGRKKVSISEASWTVWDFPYMARGRTAPDYYNKGQLLGLLLDIEIRDATDNRASLDDVMRGLYQQCMESGRGFADGDFRRWCEEVSGRSFEAFFADYVDGTAELPFVETLAKIGVVATPPQPVPGKPERRRGRWRIGLTSDADDRGAQIRRAMARGQ